MITNTVRDHRHHFLAFEIGVLRRMEFKSVVIPFGGTPNLGVYLKRSGARIATNDILVSAWTNSVALIENNETTLADDDFETILRDAYLPKNELSNPLLSKWFSSADATWFDNVRRNIDLLETPRLQAVAASLAMGVGDYALSFTGETRRFRQPLSNVFRLIAKRRSCPINNFQNNVCRNVSLTEFLVENHGDLLCLRLPHARNSSIRVAQKQKAWRDEWLLESDEFWSEVEEKSAQVIGSRVVSKSQYLKQIEDLLKTASNFHRWAIIFSEDANLGISELVDTIGSIRRIENIYTKDFSEALGTRLSIITA